MHRRGSDNPRGMRCFNNTGSSSSVLNLSALRDPRSRLAADVHTPPSQSSFADGYADFVASAPRRSPTRSSQNVPRPIAVEAQDESHSDTASTASSAYVRHHRYEDPYTAYQLVSDPYDRHREIERQRRFINDSRRLGMPFVTSGGKALEKPTRYLLGDCVAALYRTIARDWAETDPMVISTAEDLIVVYMKRERVRNTETVLRYMNASLKRSEAVRAFDLRKVPEGWDILTDDGHMMYTFKPPWVRHRRFLPDNVIARKKKRGVESMRQWAHAEADVTPSTKRRSRTSGVLSLQELPANSLQLFTRSPGDEDTPPVRLSRHIPRREGVDMSVAFYNLTTTTTTVNPAAAGLANGVVHNSIGSGGHSARTRPAMNSSAYTSFNESIISDDSSYVTSIYNEVLAEQLSSENAQNQRKIGGEVLRFDCSPRDYPRQQHYHSFKGVSGVSSHGSVHSGQSRCGGDYFASQIDEDSENRCGPSVVRSAAPKLSLQRLKPTKPVVQRVLYTNPERVLDAPEFPHSATQLLHWGSNNKLIIGLKNSLYGWNAETAQASQIVQIQEGMQIRAVNWLHKCSCVALALDHGTTAIYDCRNEEFLRTVRVRMTSKAEVSRLAVNGPLLAVGTSTPLGGVYVFDLRQKHALVSVYEGHTGGITALHYCTEEPFYLATGGADGAVRVWDARRGGCPRYTFDGVHRGPVHSILWNPDKRSKMFTGGADGMLCYVDTHAPMTNVPQLFARVDEEGPTGGTHFVTRAINTSYPISGIVSPPGTGEVATSHREKGHIQVRSAANFHLVGTLNAPNCDADIVCPTLAPDMQRVCAAQDETLKFWRVFGPAESPRRAKSATPPPPSLLENQLR